MKKYLLFLAVLSGAVTTFVSASSLDYYTSLERQNYSKAIEIKESEIQKEKEQGRFRVDVTHAGNYVALSMLYWNIGKKDDAVSAMENAIYLFKNGDNLANSECEKNAEDFLRQMKKGALPSRFTEYDFYLSGVWGYIMEVPLAVHMNRCERGINFYNSISFYCDRRMASYELQHASTARIARAFASRKYLDKAKETFSVHNPPESGTKKRKYWDACKKVHDIFSK